MKTFTMMCGLLLAGWNPVQGQVPVVEPVRTVSAEAEQQTVNVTVRLKMKAEEHWLFSAAECSADGFGKAFSEDQDAEGYVLLKMQGQAEKTPLHLDIKIVLADLEFGNREVLAYLSRPLSEGLQRDTVIDVDLNTLMPVTVIATTEGLSGNRLLLRKANTNQSLVTPFVSDQMYLLLENGHYECSLDARTDAGHVVQSRFLPVEVGNRPVTVNLKARAADFHQISFVATGLPEQYQLPFFVVDHFIPGEKGYWLEKGQYEVTANLSDTNPLLLALTRRKAFEVGSADQQVTLDYDGYAEIPVEVLVDEDWKQEAVTVRITDGTEKDSVANYSVLYGPLRAFLLKGKTYVWDILSSEGAVLKTMEQTLTDDMEKVTLDLRREGATVGISSLQNQNKALGISLMNGGLLVTAPDTERMVRVEIFTAGAVKLLQAEILSGKCLPVYLRRPGIYMIRLQQGNLTRTVKISW